MTIYDSEHHIDHPLLYYFYIVLIGLNTLDIMTTRAALTNPLNSEGNPFMAAILPYAAIIKIIYLIGVLVVADYIEKRNKHSGVQILVVLCIITGIIVMNNILILQGIKIF